MSSITGSRGILKEGNVQREGLFYFFLGGDHPKKLVAEGDKSKSREMLVLNLMLFGFRSLCSGI